MGERNGDYESPFKSVKKDPRAGKGGEGAAIENI